MDKNVKSLSMKKNIIFSWIIQILTYIIPLVTAPYIARVLTPNGVGQFSFANSITQYFVLVIAFGMVDYGTHKIAMKRNDQDYVRGEFWSIFFSRLFIYVFATLVFFILLLTWGYDQEIDKRLFLILGIGLLNSALDLTFFYRGMENFRVVSIANIIAKILFLIGLFVFVKSESDLLLYGIITVSTTFVANVIMIVIAIKTIGPIRFEKKKILTCYKESFFYFLPTIATSVISILDITVLGYMASKTEVGYYEEANKLINIISAVPLAVCPIIISRITKLKAEGNEEQIEQKFVQLFNLYALITFPAFLGIIAVNRYLIPIFFGDEYMKTIDVLYWLSPLLLCVPFSYSLCCAYYIPNNKINYITIFQFLTSGLNLVANILILKFTDLGAVGVAITSFPSAILMLALTLAFCWKHIYPNKIFKSMIKPLIAAVIMFGAIFLVDFFIKSHLKGGYILIIEVATGVVVYGICVLLLKDKIVMQVLGGLKNRLHHKKEVSE